MDDDLDDLDDITELVSVLPSRIDGVSRPASGTTFLLLKSVAAPRRAAAKAKMSPAAREAFSRNAERVRRGKRPRKAVKRTAGGHEYVMVPGPDKLAQERQKEAKVAGQVRRAAVRESQKRVAKAARTATYGSAEVPAMGRSEADAILRSVTGESGGTCGAMCTDGSPCRRSTVSGRGCGLPGHN